MLVHRRWVLISLLFVNLAGALLWQKPVFLLITVVALILYLYVQFGYLLLHPLASFYRFSGNPKRASEMLAKEGNFYNLRAYNLARIGKFNQSLADSAKAIELIPESEHCFGTRGHTYLLMGRLEDALADFQQSAALNVQHAFAYAGQSAAYFALGEPDKAREQWEQVITLKPEFEDLNRFQRLYFCGEPMLEALRRVANTVTSEK